MPYVASLAAAEKTAATLQLTVSNPGGHGSLPRSDNAIYQLTGALARLAKFQFPYALIDVTRSQFAAMAGLRSGQIAADMKAAAANADAPALARLSADPYWNALLRTTCVPTEISGGHAPNALRHRAVVTLNCRLLPATVGTDGRFLRGAGIPTNGASGVFIDEGDYRAHGRDERIRVRDFYQGVEFYNRFIRALGIWPYRLRPPAPMSPPLA